MPDQTPDIAQVSDALAERVREFLEHGYTEDLYPSMDRMEEALDNYDAAHGKIRKSISGATITTTEDGWERYDYGDGTVIEQMECPDCEHGLLTAPARLCGRCGGSGYVTRRP